MNTSATRTGKDQADLFAVPWALVASEDNGGRPGMGGEVLIVEPAGSSGDTAPAVGDAAKPAAPAGPELQVRNDS